MAFVVLAGYMNACQASGPGPERPSDRAAPAQGASQPGPEAPAGPLFVDRAAEWGLTFTHRNGMQGRRFFVEMMGAGGALFDMDGDGDLDVFLPQGHPLGAGVAETGAPADGEGGRLFRNDLGQDEQGRPVPRFVDVTAASGIRALGYGMGVAAGDADGDGLTDLYLANWGPNQLWRNLGGGRFADVTAAAGVDDPRWSVAASFLDYDRDGRQDLVVVNYNRYSLEADKACHNASLGLPDYCGPHSYPTEPGSLFRNRGAGSFEDVSLASGFAASYGPAMGVAAADLTGDGWSDILVANDGQPNLLWVNQQDGRFAEEGMARGLAVNRLGSAEANMGIVAQDLDQDCDPDVFITHLDNEMNTLWLNQGQGHFEDRTPASGLGPASLPFTGFGVADLDADNDGRADLFVTNGEVNVIAEQVGAGDPLPLKQNDLFFRGLGGGRWEEASAAAGPSLGQAAVGRGLAMGDVDNDGDTDLLQTFNNGPVRLLVNQQGQDRAWLGLELVDAQGRGPVTGVLATLSAADQAPRCRRAAADGSYASAQDPRLLFGLDDDAAGAYQAALLWPDGSRETFEGLAPGRYHRLRQGEGRP